MEYFLYDTIEEIKEVDKFICVFENIGTSDDDVTASYADALLIEEGEHKDKYAYIKDEVTSKYITEKETIEI